MSPVPAARRPIRSARVLRAAASSLGIALAALGAFAILQHGAPRWAPPARLSAGAPPAAPGAAPHPLDPLTRDEIAAAVEALRAAGRLTPHSRFPTLVLREPPKARLLAPGGPPPPREALVVVYERPQNRTFEAVVDVRARALRSWREIPDARPAWMLADLSLAERLIRADPRWQAALRRRQIADPEGVQIDLWPAGEADEAEGAPDRAAGRSRLGAGVAYYRGEGQNPYARPIEGIVAWVDLAAGRVLRVTDTGPVPLGRPAEYDSRAVGSRPALPPLRIEQPNGPGWTLRGHEVRWQNWRFRFALHPREGLVLYTVGYEDGGRLRSVLYRASVSEMLVPYGDPDPNWRFRAVFDVGDAGLGRFCFPMRPGVDAPANALLLPALFADETGEPIERPRVIALYERDGGLLWKHVDAATGGNEVRRARELVLGCIATVGNYDYAFDWVFRQDGSLALEVALSGLMLTKGVRHAVEGAEAHESGAHAHLVQPYVAAVHHQHWFNVRLDLDVDAADGNRVYEVTTAALPPGPENPYGNGFVSRERLLRTEAEARRSLDLASNRLWKVSGPRRNALGGRAAFTLLPGENTAPFLAPSAPLRRRAGFIEHHLWVTPYVPDEQYAAGAFPGQNPADAGLPAWTRANRPIEDTDVVLWYTMGMTHLPRPEEWPVMPVHRTGFRLVPTGFFRRNPALDVAP